MECPLCNISAVISSSNLVTEGDKSPDTETKIFREMKYSCRNKKCKNYNKEIGETKNQIN